MKNYSENYTKYVLRFEYSFWHCQTIENSNKHDFSTIFTSSDWKYLCKNLHRCPIVPGELHQRYFADKWDLSMGAVSWQWRQDTTGRRGGPSGPIGGWAPCIGDTSWMRVDFYCFDAPFLGAPIFYFWSLAFLENVLVYDFMKLIDQFISLNKKLIVI